MRPAASARVKAAQKAAMRKKSASSEPSGKTRPTLRPSGSARGQSSSSTPRQVQKAPPRPPPLQVILPGRQSQLLQTQRDEAGDAEQRVSPTGTSDDDIRSATVISAAEPPPLWKHPQRPVSQQDAGGGERLPPPPEAGRRRFRIIAPPRQPSDPDILARASEPIAEEDEQEEGSASDGSDADVDAEDTFHLNEAGDAPFIQAELFETRRWGLLNTVRTEATDLAQRLRSIQQKTSARVKELKDIVTRQEKLMHQFKTAFRDATTNELNEILATGWTRTGNLGFVDLRTFLKPFLESREKDPHAFLGHVPSPALRPKPLVPSKRQPRRHRLGPFAPLKVRSQRVGSPCTACWAPQFEIRTKRRDGKRPLASSPLVSEASSTATSSTERFEESTQRTLPTTVPQGGVAFDRRAIQTFVKIQRQHDGVASPRNGQEQQHSDHASSATSSISTEDEQAIENALKTISPPTFCGYPLESPFGRCLRIPVEPTPLYKEKVRRRLQRYFRERKQHRRHCINHLPGGLSSVQRQPPPSPKYPEGGLIEEVESSMSSAEIMSEIISELGESDPEIDFALLFGHGEQKLIESAAEVPNGDDEGVKRVLPQRIPDIFTTTFAIRIPPRVPRMVAELQKRDDQQPSEPETPEKAAFEEPYRQLTPQTRCCPRDCCPCDVCDWFRRPVDAVEEDVELAEEPTVPPSEVTEFWQLIDDKGEAVWIFRGRLVKPLQQ